MVNYPAKNTQSAAQALRFWLSERPLTSATDVGPSTKRPPPSWDIKESSDRADRTGSGLVSGELPVGGTKALRLSGMVGDVFLTYLFRNQA